MVLAAIGHSILHNFDYRIIISEAKRVLRLAQVLWDQNFLSFLNVKKEYVLLYLDALQNESDEEHLLGGFQIKKDHNFGKILTFFQSLKFFFNILFMIFGFVHTNIVPLLILDDSIFENIDALVFGQHLLKKSLPIIALLIIYSSFLGGKLLDALFERLLSRCCSI